MPNFTRPQPPVFERVEEERLHRKQRLASQSLQASLVAGEYCTIASTLFV